MGKLIAYCREDCYYSNNTSTILTNLKNINSNNKSNFDIIINKVSN